MSRPKANMSPPTAGAPGAPVLRTWTSIWRSISFALQPSPTASRAGWHAARPLRPMRSGWWTHCRLWPGSRGSRPGPPGPQLEPAALLKVRIARSRAGAEDSLPMNMHASRPDSLPEPPLRRTPITAERYISADYLKREWRNMWMRTWQIGGLAYQAPEAGDYLVCDLGPESILIMRQDDGGFKAFYNVCPHRGMRILQGPDGYSPHLTCPYHGWQFDRTGVVDAVFDPEDYPQGIPCGRLRLNEIQCEQLFGMVWFNMDRSAPALQSSLGEVVVREI